MILPVRRRGTKRKRQAIEDAKKEGEGDEANYRIVSEPEPESSTNGSQPALRSKLSRVIQSVLGFSDDLACFDKLHVELKSGNKSRQDTYLNMLAQFQTQVLKEREEVKKQMKSFKAKSYRACMELPGKDNQAYSELKRKLKTIKRLIDTWKLFSNND